jgi:hypothetical protein
MPAVSISPVAQGQLFNDLGAPLSGGKIFTYQGGSFSVLRTAYTNYQGTIAASNPIVLDSDGRLPYTLWLTQGARYNIVITQPDGTTVLQTFENVRGVEPTPVIGGGTVTSVDVSGGSTGLTTSGGPVETDGTITLGGTLNIASGGTGETTANDAFNALAPSQTGNAGKFLKTDGTDTLWQTLVGVPDPIPNVYPSNYYSKSENAGGPSCYVPGVNQIYSTLVESALTDYSSPCQTNTFVFSPISFCHAMTFKWLSWRGNYQSENGSTPNFRIAIFKSIGATNGLPGEKLIDVTAITVKNPSGFSNGWGEADLGSWTVEPGQLYWVAWLMKPMSEQTGTDYPTTIMTVDYNSSNLAHQPFVWTGDQPTWNYPQDATRTNTLQMPGTMDTVLGNNPPVGMYRYTTPNEEKRMPMFWLRTE